MGFLDHSTNNIIVDAVLTDTGRRLLSANDGSFRINQFALSDEEVDYSIIKKFGRNVGQEKIEKNTPVLESPTRSNLGQKYRLVALSNTYLTHLPILTLSNTGGTSATEVQLTKGDAAKESSDVSFTVTPTLGNSVDEELLDEFFFVEINNIFLTIPGSTIDIINVDNTVVYRVGTGSDSSGNTTLDFTLQLKGFSTTQFNTYKIAGSSSNPYVKVFLKVTGATSGLSKSVGVKIQRVT